MMSAAQSSLKQLKILCLHGYQQNENIFRQKSGGLRRVLKNYALFEFINAPHIVPPNDDTKTENDNDSSQAENEDKYGWWLFIEDETTNTKVCEGLEKSVALVEKVFQEKGPFDGILAFSQGATLAAILNKYGWWLFIEDETTNTKVCEGLEKSVALVEKVFQEKGPFDGILAFSQGATLAAILSILLQERKLNAQFKFVITIAGAHSLWDPLKRYSEKTINIPSLHIIGETDQIIPKARSEAFLKCFSNQRSQIHPGGHYIPSSASIKQVYVDFLKEQLQTKTAE